MSFRDEPIIRSINPHTNRLEGDDSGYRKVPVCVLDDTDPDPMVMPGVMTKPIYWIGEVRGICTYYPEGLGGPVTVLVRAPVARGLEDADKILKRSYDRKLLVVDGWRPWWVQRALWQYLRHEILVAEGLLGKTFSIYDEVRIGCKADDVGSYCAVVEDDQFGGMKYDLLNGDRAEEVATAATKLGKTPDEVARLYITFLANLQQNRLRIQEDAVTAHGNGGAVDLWMINTTTDRPVNLGVPFDFVPRPGVAISPAVINYFDMPEVTPEVYAAEVAADPTLRRYLDEIGIKKVTPDVFREAQQERRILFHTMMKLGGTYFSLDKDLGEPWHFQLGNERGGFQRKVAGLEGSGNGCHAILKGKRQAVWSNAVGHKLARKILGP